MQHLPLVLYEELCVPGAVTYSVNSSNEGSGQLDGRASVGTLNCVDLCAPTCHSCSVLEYRCIYQPQECGLLAKSSDVGVPSLPMKPRLTLWLAPVPDSQMLCRT